MLRRRSANADELQRRVENFNSRVCRCGAFFFRVGQIDGLALFAAVEFGRRRRTFCAARRRKNTSA